MRVDAATTPVEETVTIEHLDFPPACDWDQHSRDEEATHVARAVCDCGPIARLVGPECVSVIVICDYTVRCAKCGARHLSVTLEPL